MAYTKGVSEGRRCSRRKQSENEEEGREFGSRGSLAHRAAMGELRATGLQSAAQGGGWERWGVNGRGGAAREAKEEQGAGEGVLYPERRGAGRGGEANGQAPGSTGAGRPSPPRDGAATRVTPALHRSNGDGTAQGAGGQRAWAGARPRAGEGGGGADRRGRAQEWGDAWRGAPLASDRERSEGGKELGRQRERGERGRRWARGESGVGAAPARGGSGRRREKGKAEKGGAPAAEEDGWPKGESGWGENFPKKESFQKSPKNPAKNQGKF